MAHYIKLDYKIQNVNKVGALDLALLSRKVGTFFYCSLQSGFGALTTLWKSNYKRLLLEPLGSKKNYILGLLPLHLVKIFNIVNLISA